MTEAQRRKQIPIYSGLLKYFPLAIEAVAHLSFVGNEQHHPGTPLHWDMNKSSDEPDALMRHLTDEAKFENGLLPETDTDEILHLTKVAWRGLANLERKLRKNVGGDSGTQNKSN